MAIELKIIYGTSESDGNGGTITNSYSITYTTKSYTVNSVEQVAPDQVDSQETHNQVRDEIVSKLLTGQSIRYVAYVLNSAK